MSDDDLHQRRRAADRFQDQLDTRAVEIASAAMTLAQKATDGCNNNFTLLREDMQVMRSERAQQHAVAEAKFNGIVKAQWTAAIAFIGILLGWVFFLATHQH